MDDQDRIVVGVDGSPSSREALRWAARQAALTGGTVRALTSWDYPQYHGALGWLPRRAVTRRPWRPERARISPGASRRRSARARRRTSARRCTTARRPACCCARPVTRPCSWWAAGAWAASPVCSSAPSPSTVCSTRPARSSWSARTPSPVSARTRERPGPPSRGRPHRPGPGRRPPRPHRGTLTGRDVRAAGSAPGCWRPPARTSRAPRACAGRAASRTPPGPATSASPPGPRTAR